ncbi:MAG: polysaccharide deacetylase family protein [Woeseiaceae bacterium]|nr:polysaccharide deacetylase family protein [Woeseiaceae bacterium]
MRWLAVLSCLAAFSCGVSALAADSAVVLMYHRFGDDRFPSTNIRVEQLEAHLEHLKTSGYTVVSLTALMKALEQGEPLPDQAVVITVDDAYRSVAEVGHPIFRRYGYPYTVFVATDGVDEGIPDYMSWDQMRALEADGVLFANHGASHASLIDRSQSPGDHLAWARADVEKGMARLREELDPVEGVFAYPYGEFNDDIVDIVEDLDYALAFGQHSGAVGPMSHRYTLPRFPMNETYATIDQFRTKVASLPLPVESVAPADNEIVTRLPLIEVELASGIDSGEFGGLACFVGGQGRVGVDWLVRNERFRVGPERPLSPGRNRVNCTAPAGGGRYYWYSHPWFIVDP